MKREDLALELKENCIDEEAIDAFIELGLGDLEGFQSLYVGTYIDDEDFARDLAIEMGELPMDLAWPRTCIDWELAAKELMVNYVGKDGYYFNKPQAA